MDNHHDSAGQPWQGREFEANAWADDDGSAPAAYVTSIEAFRATAKAFRNLIDAPTTPELATYAAAQVAVIDAIRESRFLIPLLAEAGDVGFTEIGLKVDKTQELAIVTVAGPRDQRVLPVFSSVDAMKQWNPDARPVPADGRRVALAAAGDGADWVVIDPATATEFVVRRSGLAAIAQAQPWQPPFADDRLAEAMATAIETELDPENLVQKLELLPGDPESRGNSDELIAQLTVTTPSTEQELILTVQALSKSWTNNPLIAESVDSLRIQILVED